jgi:hypothetical protein
VAVVDEDDFVARQRQLVSASGADTVERREKRDAGVLARVLDCEPRLVGEFAEVHLQAVRRGAQHHDVRAGAEDSLLQAGDKHRPDRGMLEADALDGIGQLDVDAEIVSSASTGSRVRARRPRARSIDSVAIGPSTLSFQCL